VLHNSRLAPLYDTNIARAEHFLPKLVSRNNPEWACGKRKRLRQIIPLLFGAGRAPAEEVITFSANHLETRVLD
jgi:hypothetical protein